MICAIDIETRGLNATKFILGCIITERNEKNSKVFYKKEDLWNYVIKLGMSEYKRKKVLNVYSHNASFDTAGYFNWEDKNLRLISQKPFIAEYKHPETKKTIIKFLDSLSIYKMSLEKVGKTIGIQKKQTPNELKNNEELPKKISKEKLREIEPSQPKQET